MLQYDVCAFASSLTIALLFFFNACDIVTFIKSVIELSINIFLCVLFKKLTSETLMFLEKAYNESTMKKYNLSGTSMKGNVHSGVCN